MINRIDKQNRANRIELIEHAKQNKTKGIDKQKTNRTKGIDEQNRQIEKDMTKGQINGRQIEQEIQNRQIKQDNRIEKWKSPIVQTDRTGIDEQKRNRIGQIKQRSRTD